MDTTAADRERRRVRSQRYWTYIYFFQSTVSPYLVKIGESARPFRRLRDLMIGSPVKLIPVFLIKANVMAEQMLHFAFLDQRVHGEWFKPHPKLKGLVQGWKSSKHELLTPDIAESTIPLAATNLGDPDAYPGAQPSSLQQWLGYYRVAFEVDGIGTRSHSRRRPLLAWRNTQVVK
jgi:hypothetical protein